MASLIPRLQPSQEAPLPSLPAPYERARALYASLLSGGLAVPELEMRRDWVRDLLSRVPLAEAARALDLLCSDAEQAAPEARELLGSIVLLLLDAESEALAQHLREEAAGASLLSLGRLLRRPPPHIERRESRTEKPVPDYGKGRALTLGERKALARRPDRKSFDRLIRDPSPDVIHNLLRNPRMTEDDAVRLAAMRPTRAEILSEIARHPRWSSRARVRLALVLNPYASPEIAVPLVALLVRHELRLVVEVTDGSPLVRAVALELLQRRPPSLDEEPAGEDEPVQ